MKRIIFAILILTLAIFGVKLFKNTFDIGKTYTISFQDINGIEIGSPVRILGVDVGHVTKIKNDFDEDGTTFEENAIIKAKTICDITGDIVLADDSGLEVDYLGGAPGIYSARFMGEDTSYTIKNNAIIIDVRKRLTIVTKETTILLLGA